MNQIFNNLSFEDYAKHEAVNASLLCEFAVSPAHGKEFGGVIS